MTSPPLYTQLLTTSSSLDTQRFIFDHHGWDSKCSSSTSLHELRKWLKHHLKAQLQGWMILFSDISVDLDPPCPVDSIIGYVTCYAPPLFRLPQISARSRVPIQPKNSYCTFVRCSCLPHGILCTVFSDVRGFYSRSWWTSPEEVGSSPELRALLFLEKEKLTQISASLRPWLL